MDLVDVIDIVAALDHRADRENREVDDITAIGWADVGALEDIAGCLQPRHDIGEFGLGLAQILGDVGHPLVSRLDDLQFHLADCMLRDKAVPDRRPSLAMRLLQCDAAEVRCAGGAVLGPQGSVSIAEIAKVAHLRMDGLPPGVDPLLDATATYEPAIGTGVFSYATHGAVVAVDPQTGFIELLDFALAEDCGTILNPMIVDGQIRGGVVQGIGTALCEEIPYDETGQPLAGTLADYLLPSAAEMPGIKIGHLHTPTPHTEYGMKGMGEGGAVARPPRSPTPSATPFLRSAPKSTKPRSLPGRSWRR
jgi:carbon-monoxide dehydrogenase large subunit